VGFSLLRFTTHPQKRPIRNGSSGGDSAQSIVVWGGEIKILPRRRAVEGCWRAVPALCWCGGTVGSGCALGYDFLSCPEVFAGVVGPGEAAVGASFFVVIGCRPGAVAPNGLVVAAPRGGEIPAIPAGFFAHGNCSVLSLGRLALGRRIHRPSLLSTIPLPIPLLTISRRSGGGGCGRKNGRFDRNSILRGVSGIGPERGGRFGAELSAVVSVLQIVDDVPSVEGTSSWRKEILCIRLCLKTRSGFERLVLGPTTPFSDKA
jgi:hypothetical protein